MCPKFLVNQPGIPDGVHDNNPQQTLPQLTQEVLDDISIQFNMADRGSGAPRGAGFGSRGDRGGDRGRGRGGRRGGRRGGGKSDEKEWQPVTKLGRLVKAGKIKSMEEIYLHSLPIKEYQIVDFFLPKLKDEVMKVRRSHHPHQSATTQTGRRKLGNRGDDGQ